MTELRTIEIKQEILAENSREADAFRAARRAEGTYMIDIMGSPGAGKTTLLLALIEKLRSEGGAEIGVIEADLASDVDALKIKEAGVAAVELNTKNVCHVEMGMVEQAYAAFAGKSLTMCSWRTLATWCVRRSLIRAVTAGSCCCLFRKGTIKFTSIRPCLRW